MTNRFPRESLVKFLLWSSHYRVLQTPIVTTHSWTLSKQNTLEYLYKTLLPQVFFTSLQVSTEGFGALELIWTGGSQREYFQNLYNNIKMRDLTSKLRDQHQCRGTSTSAEGLEHSAPYWGQVHSAEEL